MRHCSHTRITLAQYTVLFVEQELRPLAGPVKLDVQKKKKTRKMWCVGFALYRVTLRKSVSLCPLYDNFAVTNHSLSINMCRVLIRIWQPKTWKGHCTSLREGSAPFPENGDNGSGIIFCAWLSCFWLHCLAEKILSIIIDRRSKIISECM
jgi:hypothetical protein